MFQHVYNPVPVRLAFDEIDQSQSFALPHKGGKQAFFASRPQITVRIRRKPYPIAIARLAHPASVVIDQLLPVGYNAVQTVDTLVKPPKIIPLAKQHIGCIVALDIRYQLEIDTLPQRQFHHVSLIPYRIALLGTVETKVSQSVEDWFPAIVFAAAETMLVVIDHGIGPQIDKIAIQILHPRARQLIVFVTSVNDHDHEIGLCAGVTNRIILLHGVKRIGPRCDLARNREFVFTAIDECDTLPLNLFVQSTLCLA